MQASLENEHFIEYLEIDYGNTRAQNAAKEFPDGQLVTKLLQNCILIPKLQLFAV